MENTDFLDSTDNQIEFLNNNLLSFFDNTLLTKTMFYYMYRTFK